MCHHCPPTILWGIAFIPSSITMTSFKKVFILGSLFALASAGLMKSLNTLQAPTDHIADPLSEFEADCLCGDDEEGTEVETVTPDGLVVREKRCGCGYGYCGCGAAAAAAPAATPAASPPPGGFIVVPVPHPAPAPAPVHAPAPVQTVVESPSSIDKLANAISGMNSLAALQGLNAKAGNANTLSANVDGSGVCDKLRLILSLTKQLEGFKLVEIAGQCVVQPE